MAFFRDNADRVTAGSWLFMIGSLLFIWFAGALRRRLSAAEEGRDVFAPLAFAAGVATGILTLGMAAGGLAAALSVDEITASTAEALNGVELVFFVSAELAAVVLLTASAAAAWRTRPFPRWWAIASLVIAVWLLIAPIGWIALLVGVPVWTVVTSVILDRGAAPVR